MPQTMYEEHTATDDSLYRNGHWNRSKTNDWERANKWSIVQSKEERLKLPLQKLECIFSCTLIETKICRRLLYTTLRLRTKQQKFDLGMPSACTVRIHLIRMEMRYMWMANNLFRSLRCVCWWETICCKWIAYTWGQMQSEAPIKRAKTRQFSIFHFKFPHVRTLLIRLLVIRLILIFDNIEKRDGETEDMFVLILLFWYIVVQLKIYFAR